MKSEGGPALARPVAEVQATSATSSASAAARAKRDLVIADVTCMLNGRGWPGGRAWPHTARHVLR